MVLLSGLLLHVLRGVSTSGPAVNFKSWPFNVPIANISFDPGTFRHIYPNISRNSAWLRSPDGTLVAIYWHVDVRNGRQILILVFIASLIIAAELALYSVRWIVAISILGIGFGVIISPAFDLLHRRFKVPRAVSVLTTAILFLLSLSLLGFFLFDRLADQFNAVAHGLPDFFNRAMRKTSDIFVRFPWIEQQIKQLGEESSIRELIQRTQQGLRVGVTAIAGFIFFSVTAIYLALNPSYYFQGIQNLIPENHRSQISAALLEIAKNLRRWFTSQLIAMAIVGALTTFALWVIGVDYWLLFGVLSGILDIIPYIGPTIPAAGAIIVSLASEPDKVPWIVAAYIVIQQLESHIVIPNIMRHRMQFAPIPLMIMMLIMGKWFGVIGLLLTPGIFTVLVTLNSVRTQKKKESAISSSRTLSATVGRQSR